MLIPFTSASFTNLSGLAVADGAAVEVRLELNGALAALFDDRAGTTPLTNPFNADSHGRFEFYVAGRIDGYSIQVTKGAQTHTLRHQLTASAAATLFDNTGTGLLAESVQDAIVEIGTKLTDFWVSVKDAPFGATGDGTTDDVTAIQAAIDTVGNAGGGLVYFPEGTYLCSTEITLQSNVFLLGAGPGASLLKNTGGSNIAIDIRGTLGNVYAINAPTEGSNTVTTTTAGNAGNFSIGGKIGLAGAFVGADYIPLFITTVINVNAGTGVITVAEKLRHADYTQVVQVTTELENIGIRDMGISQAADSAMLIKYARNVFLDNVVATVSNAAYQFVGCRELNIRNMVAVDKKFLLHSCVGSTLINPIVRGNDFVLEGGCTDVDVFGIKIYDPASTAITINTGSKSCRFIGGAVVNVPSGGSGVLMNGASFGSAGGNVICGLTISGGGVGADGIATNTSNRNVIFGNSIRGFTTGIRIGSGNCLDTVAFGNSFFDVTNEYVVDAGSNIVAQLIPENVPLFVDGDTTPSVAGGNVYETVNTNPTSITTLDDGREGQIVTIIFGDANTTLVASGSLRLDGSANFVAPVRAVTQLVRHGSSWYQTGKPSLNN